MVLCSEFSALRGTVAGVDAHQALNEYCDHRLALVKVALAGRQD